MIINIRGTNGSGKTTAARSLFEEGGVDKPLVSYATKTGAIRWVTGVYVKKRDLIVVGSYATKCGGCDGIKTQDLICEAVRAAAGLVRYVVFEGVLVSTLFSRYANLSEELGTARRPFLWAYLDTPLDVCLKRIQERNGGKAINEKLVADKIRSISSTRAKAIANGEGVLDVPYEKASAFIQKQLGWKS